jgi:hypothetical protein
MAHATARPLFLIAAQLGKLIAEQAGYADEAARDLCFNVSAHMQEECLLAVVQKELGTLDDDEPRP